MIRLDSSALRSVAPVLGISAGSATTYFDDDQLQQVLDVSKLIRRDRTLGHSSGLYGFMIRNSHTVAAEITTNVDPYADTASAPALGSYPKLVDPAYDAWLLSSVAWRESGDALVNGMLRIHYGLAMTGIGPSGVAFGLRNVLRAYHIATLGELTISELAYFRSIGDGLIGAQHPVRIPRGASITWQTIGAGIPGGAAEYRVAGVIGLFPAGLGQDGNGGG